MRKPTQICFVRHGETSWNIEQRMQGHIDQPLNVAGEAQACALGHYFSGQLVAALYSSDLLRARHTALPLAQSLALPVIPLVPLRERCFGRCEGLTFAEIAARYQEDARAILSRDPDYVAPGGGESRRQHEVRILACVEELVRKHSGQSIVVVTHGGVLDVIYRRVHGLPLGSPRDYPIPNGGVNWVSIAGDQWEISLWAGTAHLGPL